MISCFFHHRAIRRHLDDSEPLSQSTTGHVEQCADCRELLATHALVMKRLTTPPAQIEAPPFLHARVMNSLRETPTAHRRDPNFQWAAAMFGIALLTLGIAVLPSKRPAEPTPAWPTLGAPISLKTSLPENPLESEIKNLREDTLNAAKALAATFLPDAEESK